MNRIAILAGLGLALAGCGDNSGTQATDNEEASARGEVLGGSITDDMLPLDTITSQAPSLASEEGEPAATGNAAPGDQAEGEPAAGPEAEEQPVTEPADDPAE